MQSSGPPSTTAGSAGPTNTTSQSVGTIATKPAGNVIRPGQQTSYHVPRGAAAVASIAMPRPSSLATVRAGPTGSLVSIRGSSRVPSPAPHQPGQQGPRTRPASSPAHSGTRPLTPQRSDTPRPALNTSLEKTFGKSTVPLAQVQARTTPLVGQGRIAAPPALSAQPVQIVTQAVTLATCPPVAQPGTPIQVVTQGVTPMQVVTQTAHGTSTSAGIQPTLSSVSSVAGKPRPISQGTQAGTVTTIPTNTPAVVLAAPARLASPGLIGVQTGTARLAVATALPASGARIVSPSARVPQGRTVTYTTPVRLGGRGVVSLHPVLGVAPLKPAPAPTSAASSQAQAGGQASGQVSVVTSQPTTLPSLQPAPVRTLPGQQKVMASAVVTVAAVGGGPLRSVVASVPPGVTAASSLAPVSSISTAPSSTSTAKAVAARPVAVAGQQVRPAPGQPSVYIQTAPHRASPGPAGERTGTFPIQPAAYFYEAPSGSFQVANVQGRTYAGGPPYIVQATTARPVAGGPQQLHAIASTAGPTASGAGTTSSVPVATSVVTSVVSSASGSAVSTITGSVVSTVTAGQPGQPPRFNSIMVLDPSRTALPIHAVVPAEGGATGTTYIAADGSLLPVQTLPVPVSGAATQAASNAPAASQSSTETQQSHAPTQIVTQVASVVSQAVTSSTTGHLPVQIQMVPTPVHIQMHPQTQAQMANPIQHSGAQTVTTSHVSVHASHPTSLASHQSSHVHPPSSTPSVSMSLALSHQVLSHSSSSHASSQPQPLPLPNSSLHPSSQTHTPQGPTSTTPSKLNASPRPSILRKRDNEGSPMKAAKNLTPLLQSMSSVNPIPVASLPSSVHPPSPPSPPKRPDSGGPQSSGSTTISATSSPGQESPPPGASQPPPSAASITAGLHAAGLHGTEMSPRKKPRKQQLTGNELQEHKASDEEMEFMAEDNGDDFPLNPQPQEPQQLHQQVLQQQQQSQQQQAALPPPPPAPREFTLKRPNISLLSTYRYSWKSRNNHFLRHSDVKPKDERRPSVNELASQRHIYQRLNGWKVHHLTAQMEDLADVESQVCQQLEAMLGVMERKAQQDEDKDVNRVSELIKGNMQRSRVIADQLREAKATVMKIFDHKPHVSDIIHRSSGKRERIFKKREKS
ncbi:hypothetical protein FOCC_FOCC012170 [Frankliniella occidentalis]|uniref:Mucin-5AC isoform X2 n=1 Tax=Frankliniella occidentalis TaxID=133901 RepID=A0A6J1T9Z0_FRAOC|nr:mucin-5AC isoform X2 [Frankliniella occidentalis]KAE8742291.1 hypothetical protein FOCC_FOCC012170 [Frankliniella occidentalis]